MFQTILFVTIMTTTALLFNNTFGTLIDPTDHRFNVRRLEQCYEQNRWNISLNFVNFKVVKQDGIHATFSGIMEAVKPIQINFRLSVHGLLCDGPEDRSCSHMFIRPFGYVCTKFNDSNGPWFPFLLEKFTCPIPTGYYNMGTMTIDINNLIQLPLTKGYWVLKAIGYQGKEVIMCVYSELVITHFSRRALHVLEKSKNDMLRSSKISTKLSKL